MLEFKKQLFPDTTLIVWKMDEDLDQLAAQTNLDAIANFDQLSPKRKKEKAFVNYLLQQQLPDARIDYEEGGRPFLPNYPGTSISISHTGNFACLLISKQYRKIGVDIEKNNTAKVLRVRHKFMTDEEVALHPTADEGTDALLAWTTKEALFKLADPPHYDFIEGFRITASTMNGNEGSSLVRDLMDDTTYEVRHWLTPDYALTLCLHE